MRTRRMCATAVAAVAATTALGLATTGAAQAEPTPAPVVGKAATYRLYAGVGSDTIQDVWNGLSNGYAGHRATITNVASWNAFPQNTTIVTKNGGPAFSRPNGSGAGVKALTASAKGTQYAGVAIKNQVDFARSSSGPNPGTDLTYMPFARDAVSVAVKTSVGGTINLTTTDLTNIYTCKKTTITTSTGQTFAVKPRLPQASSGTLKFFVGAIGNPALGSCVDQTTLPENDGSAFANAGDIFPFSAAQWIAQKNGVSANTIPAGITLADINGLKAVVSSGTKLAPGGLYGSLTRPVSVGTGIFARDTYNVIPAAKRRTALEFTLTMAAKQATVLKDFGFGPLSYAGNSAYYKAGGFQS